MRYYLFEMPTLEERAAGDRPHISQEHAVYVEEAERADRGEMSRGDVGDFSRLGIAGIRTLICTREELLSHSDGRRALLAWEARDDSVFEAEWARRRKMAEEADTRMLARSDEEWEEESRAEGLALGLSLEEVEGLMARNEKRRPPRQLRAVPGGVEDE